MDAAVVVDLAKLSGSSTRFIALGQSVLQKDWKEANRWEMRTEAVSSLGGNT